MKINYELILREIAGDTFLVPIGEAAQQYNGMFVLNELGAFLWQHMEAAQDEEALVELVLNQYDVTREEATADIQEFIQGLREMGIVE